MPVKKLLNQTQFGKHAKVSRQAVSKACNSVLKDAMFEGSVDIEHAKAIKYVADQAAKRAAKEAKQVDKSVNQVDKPTPSEKVEGIESDSEPKTTVIQEAITSELSTEDALKMVEGLTIKQLMARYGTAAQFKDFVTAHKVIESVHLQQLLRAEKEGSLIPREMVKTYIFGAIEDLNMKLLMDAPKTIVRRLIAHLKSGEDVELGEDLVRSIMSDQLKPLPSKIRKSLNNV